MNTSEDTDCARRTNDDQVDLVELLGGGDWLPAVREPRRDADAEHGAPGRAVSRPPRLKSVNPLAHLTHAAHRRHRRHTQDHTHTDTLESEGGMHESPGCSPAPPQSASASVSLSACEDDSDAELGVGSMVEVATHQDHLYYGVVRWIGRADDTLYCGVELEEGSAGLGDGTHGGARLFSCAPGRALFVPAALCRRDPRFRDDAPPAPAPAPATLSRDSDDVKVVVVGRVPPRSGLEGGVCGKNRGIQGHHNSCYLDATLFAMFMFTGVFDSLLYRPPEPQDGPHYSEVQRVLREEIVNPLRRHMFVRADRVMKLRKLLERLSDISGLTSEEKDPEEFLNSLVAQTLRAEPFLKLSSGQEAYYYQLFVEKDHALSLPTVQQLMEQSLQTSGVRLREAPAVLIVQMPRFGKAYKMYPRILPSPLLDVTDLVRDVPRQCTVCGAVARWECAACLGDCGPGLESTAFCGPCLAAAHAHAHRLHHQAAPLSVPAEYSGAWESCAVPRLYMELFAVLCIETSHYVAFVKAGSGDDAPWCFFDSMADRKGERDGYNIPEVCVALQTGAWLSDEGGAERALPPHARRLLCDAYMCLYRSPDVAMYT